MLGAQSRARSARALVARCVGQRKRALDGQRGFAGQLDSSRRLSKTRGNSVNAIRAFWTGLADLQVRHSTIFLIVAALICVGSLPLIHKLELDSRFAALLPDNQP